jgi:hypothetical protein
VSRLQPQSVTPPRYNRAVPRTESANAAERAAHFLRSPAGRATIHRTLTARQLPRSLADDLIQDVLGRVCAAAGQGVAIDNVEAFATRLAQRSAVDIVRGRIRHPQLVDLRGVDPDAEVQGQPFAVASPLDVEADALAGEALAAVRRLVHHRLAADPSAGAAALAYLAVMVEGASPGDRCPQPLAGASPDEAAEWAALWYGGRRDCFAGDATTTPATVRKRRSRLVHRFRDVLTGSAATAGLERQEAMHHG